MFGSNEFLKKYPYFLPCAVPATYTLCAWFITYFLLKETVKNPTPFKDLFFKSKDHNRQDRIADLQSVIHEHDDIEKPLPLRSLMTFQVIIAGSNYAFLSLVEISFRAIQPLFFSTPVELGGLGLSPSTIGNILSAFGICNGCFQIFFFARIHDYWGSKKVFIAGIMSGIPLFLSFPVINQIAREQGYSATLWVAVGAQTLLSIMPSMSYGAPSFMTCAACGVSPEPQVLFLYSFKLLLLTRHPLVPRMAYARFVWIVYEQFCRKLTESCFISYAGCCQHDESNRTRRCQFNVFNFHCQ